MTPLIIFFVQLAGFLLLAAVLAWRWIWPAISKRPIESALAPMVGLHTSRTIALVFLLPGVVDEAIPRDVLRAIAYGDVATAALALATLVALRPGGRAGVALAWVFNLVGVVDLTMGTLQGLTRDIGLHLTPALLWIPTYLIPALFMTHAVMLARLFTRRRDQALPLSVAGTRVS
jgi:hypothetical protein